MDSRLYDKEVCAPNSKGMEKLVLLCGADFLSSAMGGKGMEMEKAMDIFGELWRLKWASYLT